MLCNRSAQLGVRAAAVVQTQRRSAAVGRAAAAAAVDWGEKGSMVYRDPMEERDAAYLKATSANGLMSAGPLLTEEADYLSEARVDYMYKGPCDSTSSLQLNSATQFMLDNGGHSQPVNTHHATVGSHVPQAVNLSGTRLSHLHFQGASSGLCCKFVSNNLIAAHPSRQLHTSAVARQQGVQDDAGILSLEFERHDRPNAQGIQGEADSAQARLWVSRCLGDGLNTDCAVPADVAMHQRKTVQQLFVQMLVDIRSTAETYLKPK